MDGIKKAIDKFEIPGFSKGFFAKLFDFSYSHSIQNHYPTKMDVLPKTVVQIILSAIPCKW